MTVRSPIYVTDLIHDFQRLPQDTEVYVVKPVPSNAETFPSAIDMEQLQSPVTLYEAIEVHDCNAVLRPDLIQLEKDDNKPSRLDDPRINRDNSYLKVISDTLDHIRHRNRDAVIVADWDRVSCFFTTVVNRREIIEDRAAAQPVPLPEGL